MNDYTTKKRYCPHLLETKLHAVEIYRQTKDISFVCRRYHISKASLMRWNRAYDGTRESLQNKSHKPHTSHPNAHTEQELKWICDYHRRNPNISVCELYGKLREDKAYRRHPGSLYRVFVRLGFRKKPKSTKKSPNTPEHTIHRPLSAKMANGCQICAECLLFRQGWAEILSIYGHRGSVPETVSLCI